MSHRVTVEGRRLYAWCAWDSLFLPGIIGKAARVESTCPVTGETISLTVTPEAIADLSPPGAMLSFLRPRGDFERDTIERFCHYVLFFASEDAARQWTSEHRTPSCCRSIRASGSAS